jgi:uncharacterized protein (DUF2141 family)
LTPGSYKVTEQSKDGWQATTKNPQTATVVAGKTANVVFGNKQISTTPQTGTLKIYKFWDANSNAQVDCEETGLAGWTFTIVDSAGKSTSAITDDDGWIKIYNLAPGDYRVTEQSKDGWVATTANPQTAKVIAGQTANLIFGNKQTTSTSQTGSLSIFKFWDKNGNGKQDCDEIGLSGWTFSVVDASGKTSSGTTDNHGLITINNLTPGLCKATEQGKSGWIATTANPQAVTIIGGKTANLTFGNQKLAGLDCGDTATIGFWNNKNGQAIINTKGGDLDGWLATSFPNIYGQLNLKTNSDVAVLFQKCFNVQGQKTDAQILAGALACYFTQSTYSNTLVSKYGFNVSALGTGVKLYNVASYGTAIGLTNNQSYTVYQLLQQINLLKQNGTYSSKTASACNSIFDGINSQGDIN